jgi:phosphoglycerate dehydrogenase-like enzyme
MPVATTVLILDNFAEIYAASLRERYPQLNLLLAKSAVEISFDVGEADVLIAFGIAINEELMRRATRLKWIQSLATGVDHFLNSPYLLPRTLLTSARGIHGNAMRETVAFLMLSLTHETPVLVRNQLAHRWDRRTWPLLAGKTAVIAGVGLSSAAIANLLQAFGMRVIGTTRTPRAVEGFDRIEHTDRLVEFAGEADYLINILPSTRENRDLIGASIFAAMKNTAFFINVGRGETVDEQALIAALRGSRIAGAGLDVYRSEPLPAESPLWDMPNVVACPHIGGFFREYEEYVLPIVIENMGLFLAGRYNEMRNLIPH